MPAARHAARHLLLAMGLAAASAHAADLTYLLTLREDTRVRSPLPGDLGQGTTADVELLPGGTLGLAWEKTALALSYTPSILLREPQLGGRVLPLHRGRVGLTQAWRGATLAVSEDFSVGDLDVGSLRQPEGGTPGGVAEVQTLGATKYVRSATLATLDTPLARRLGLSLSAGYQVSGGTDVAAAMPLQHGPSFSAQLGHEWTRRDKLTARLQVTGASFSTKQEQLISQLLGGYVRQLSRFASVNALAGLAVTRELIPEGAGLGEPGEYFEILPVGSVSLATSVPVPHQYLALNGTVRLFPFSDRFTGAVYERLELAQSTEWRPVKGLSLTEAAGLAWAVPVGLAVQAGDKLYYGELGAAWTSVRWLKLAATGRLLWAEQPRLMTPGQLQWVVTLSVALLQQNATAW